MGRRAAGPLAVLALALAVVALAPAPAGAADDRRVILAFYEANPQQVVVKAPGPDSEREDTLLRFFDDEPSLSAGLWSSVHGSYNAQQAVLDVSQGTRQPSGLYGGVDENDDSQLDDLRLDLATGTFTNWQLFRDRAHDVSRTIRPGLLAGSVPGGGGFVGVARRVAAAGDRGRRRARARRAQVLRLGADAGRPRRAACRGPRSSSSSRCPSARRAARS